MKTEMGRNWPLLDHSISATGPIRHRTRDLAQKVFASYWHKTKSELLILITTNVRQKLAGPYLTPFV